MNAPLPVSTVIGPSLIAPTCVPTCRPTPRWRSTSAAPALGPSAACPCCTNTPPQAAAPPHRRHIPWTLLFMSRLKLLAGWTHWRELYHKDIAGQKNLDICCFHQKSPKCLTFFRTCVDFFWGHVGFQGAFVSVCVWTRGQLDMQLIPRKLHRCRPVRDSGHCAAAWVCLCVWGDVIPHHTIHAWDVCVCLYEQVCVETAVCAWCTVEAGRWATC